ncbi:MAG: hypothetical protein V1875_00355 [Candidatus Altiarchaeota archaeon]
MKDGYSAEGRPLAGGKNADEEVTQEPNAKGLVRFKSQYADEWIRPDEFSLYRELDAVRERHVAIMDLEKKLERARKEGEDARKAYLERLKQSDDGRKQEFAALEERVEEARKSDAERQKKSDDQRNQQFAELEKRSAVARMAELERQKKLDDDRKLEFAELKKGLEDARRELERQKKADDDRKMEYEAYEKNIGDRLQEMKRLEQEIKRLELQIRMTASEVAAESSTIRSARWEKESKSVLNKKG